ncbi:MAG: methyltransferase domain-containing protein [Verrucomicrobiaceae bacterium]|nr:methyltransferase domain-containing protein [Verrucomicrobiaceae bacterium]
MQPSPALFFDTINAFHKSAALKAAIDLELFSAIGDTPATAAELAGRCEASLRGVRILADYLVILGFLTKGGERYALTPDSAFFLVRNSPAYCGAAGEFLHAPAVADCFGDLAAAVRKGGTATTKHGTVSHENPVWEKFARAMGPMMIPCAFGAAALVDLPQDRDTRILDIAAGHGFYGITFAQMNPRAHLVALDWPAVVKVAQENACAAGLAARFSTIAGDAFSVGLGEDYDIVLVPNFLHHFSRAGCVAFLRRVHAALRPGGRIVIVEFVPDENRVTPPPAAGFALVMLATTPEGDAYTFAEYEQMLVESGFSSAICHPLPPTAQSAVIADRK